MLWNNANTCTKQQRKKTQMLTSALCGCISSEVKQQEQNPASCLWHADVMWDAVTQHRHTNGAEVSSDASVTHLVRFTLLLLLPLLLLVFLLVVDLSRFPPGCSCLPLPGLPGGVPSAFGAAAVSLPRLGCVGVRIRVNLEQGEPGGRGGDGDHGRRCHSWSGNWW